jgi:hypothetical protein
MKTNYPVGKRGQESEMPPGEENHPEEQQGSSCILSYF